MRFFRLCLAVALAGFAAGCVGTPNPAAPPGPPAELPSALRYPSDLSIDVGTISTESPASALRISQDAGEAPAALVGSGGDFSDEISLGPLLYDPLSQFVNQLLQPLPTFDIPVGTDTTTFEISVPFESLFESGGAETQPETPSGLPLVDIKIDFADFDFDGDGVKDGCSGHTAALPICYRIWFDGVRRMAGVFTDFPTAENQAAGSFRILLHKAAEGDQPATDVYVGIVYDDRDPFRKSTEIFERFVPVGSSPDGSALLGPDTHVFVSRDGTEETSRKRLALSMQGFPEEFSFDVTGTPNDFKYLAQWREDAVYWSGSVETHNIDIQNFTGVCAFIPSGDAANVGNCLDLSIDVGGIPFLDFLATEDVRLPADFPESPTF